MEQEIGRDYKAKKLFGLLVIVFILLSGCSQKPKRKVEHAFYFWQSNFTLTKEEFKYLKTLDVKKLYIRFFDVDWNPNQKIPVPVGDVQIETDSLNNIEIVPAVFITNRTLENMSDTLIQDLAGKILKKITDKLTLFKNLIVKELQLDCDWTGETRNKYFQLIKDIEKNSLQKNIEVTATIRLHQVKYFKLTGVPPVKRGMLMFYNMSPVSNFHTKNSIYDQRVAENYLVNFNQYPLPLDVALPAFSWGVLFRGNKIIALINDLNANELLKHKEFKRLDDTHYRAVKDIIFEGRYLKKLDTIRLEEITPEITKSAAELIAPKIKNDSLAVAIYHLNNELIKNYEPQDIQDCYSAFR